MTIGARILQARLECGLSQRQLAGENITRNMLSAIEHDKARPSLDTLIYLSGMLGKSVGWFLGEETPMAAGYTALQRARNAYDGGSYRECLSALEEGAWDEVLGREAALLRVLATLALAEQALEDGRMPYARALLDNPMGEECPYYTSELERRYQMLRARAGLNASVPEEGTLLLRAEAALREKRFSDANRYLDAVDERDDRWNYLMGEALFGLADFAGAAECFHRVEETMPQAVRRKLQLCYAALKNFEMAYYYATLE